MNNKVTLQDLAEQLSNISGQSKKLSETFLRSLTEIIEEALEKDGIAKVKGLGTFKIIAIEERKSVSVTDGSAVVIPAHKKITFTPEKELKEAINKPYEHLETYILPTDGPVDAPVTDEDEEEGYVEEEVAAAVAGAIPNINSTVIGGELSNEAKAVSSDPISSIKTITTQEEPTNIDIASEEEKATEVRSEEPKQVETPTEVTTEINATETTPTNEKPSDKVAEEAVIEVVSKPAEILTEEAPVAETSSETASEATKEANEDTAEPVAALVENPTPATEPQQKEKKKGKKGLLIVIILLILLLLACLFYAHKQNPNFSSKLNDIKEQITQLFTGGENATPTVTPAVVDSTPALSEVENNEQSEAFFEENEDETILEAAENEGIVEEPVKEVNYDWFEAEFKKFMKREHPKIKVEVMGEPTIDTIKAGKTLTSMSRKYYNGGKDFWVYIYLYNKDVIRRPDDVPAGKVIKIPQLHPSMVNPSSHESVNAAKDVKESYLRLFN